MNYIVKSSLLTCFLACNASLANNLTMSGTVLDDSGSALPGVTVVVGNQSVVSDKEGKFAVSAKSKAIYQLQFEKAGYFQMVHSFSASELADNSQLPFITLVAKQDKRVMLAFGGDVMMGRRYYNPYFGDEVLIHDDNKLADSKSIVKHIKPYMSLADYAAVNLESQIATQLPGERASKSVTFYSQPETLHALAWAGIDYVSLGNNHTYDYLKSGLESTLGFLQASDLGYSGAGMNEAQALKPYRQTVQNTEFSMLGYVGWEGSSKPTQTANHAHGGAAYGSMVNMLASVKREVESSRVPIVQYHGSQEYANNPTGVTEQRLKSSLDAGAALAIAHHPHVTQGLELYDGKLIAYSMGNFIFDQNFSATQHSFILYVWLDGEKFHRAEIVPLYVKGYKPTPATGMHRHTVMKRLTALSKTRGTFISQSGGHGVITAANQPSSEPIKQVKVNLPAGERTASLYHLPWHKQLSRISLPKGNKYRVGTNLINGSDFESFATFDAKERGWLYDRSTTSLNNYGAASQRSLAIVLNNKQPAVFGMQSFRRVYAKSQPMTIKARFKTAKPVKARFYWQGRKTRQKLFDAFDNSPKNLIKTVELSDGQGWQTVEVDFNSPRIGYRSYRVLVEFEAGFEVQDGTTSQLDIDDFALIEWQTAYSNLPAPNLRSVNARQATFIGFELPLTQPLGLYFR